MTNLKNASSRRNFIKRSTAMVTGLGGAMLLPPTNGMANNPMSDPDNINFIGPKDGFSPQIGTMVSMMNWMRNTILYPVKDLTMEELDYLHDKDANSIGAMLLHLAATEKYYQLNSFDGMEWGSWSEDIKKKWDVPMGLGKEGRKKIKGNNLDYYLDILKEVREKTIAEFRKRDDEWLLTLDKGWGWNNYCKWFHVCEHESNHNGQIKFIVKRLPSKK